MAIMRRIYGMVDESTFANFRARARDEGLSLADAFEAIVIAYAKGLRLVRTRAPEVHHKSENGFPLPLMMDEEPEKGN